LTRCAGSKAQGERIIQQAPLVIDVANRAFIAPQLANILNWDYSPKCKYQFDETTHNETYIFAGVVRIDANSL